MKAKARRQLGENPSEREVKDFIVAAIETSLSETLRQLGFSRREVKDLLEGSTKALTSGGEGEADRSQRSGEGARERPRYVGEEGVADDRRVDDGGSSAELTHVRRGTLLAAHRRSATP